MEVGCELQLLSGGGRVIFITDSSLAVGLKTRQWKPISTGGYLNMIFPLAVGVTEPLVEIRFSLAVRLHQPPVEIWRLCYDNRQWKYVSTGGSQAGPIWFFYCRAVTETASDNLWVPQTLSSFLLVVGRSPKKSGMVARLEVISLWRAIMHETRSHL
jgi:hypothetical protein